MTVRGMWGAEFAALGNSSSRQHLDGLGFAPGGGGSATTQPGSARSGSWGYRLSSGAGFSDVAWAQFGGKPVAPGEKIAWRFYMKLDALPAGTCRIIDFGGGFFNQGVYLEPDGRINFGGFPTRRPELDNPLPVGSWVRVEFAMSYSGTATRCDLLAMRINGEMVWKKFVSKVIVDPGSTDQLLVGWRESPGGARTMHVDDVTITQDVWPGEGQVLRLMATNHILGDGWVPGKWQNIEARISNESRDPPVGEAPECNCGDQQSGVETSEAPDSGLITGMNAAPPVGVIASAVGGEGRDLDADKMASTPGQDLYNLFQGWGGGRCEHCPLSQTSAYNLWAWRTHLHRYETADGGYLTAQLAVNGEPIRAANWRVAVAEGTVFPGVGNQDGQGLCKIRLPALEPDVVNFDLDTVGEGGDWPTNWTTLEGPMHQEPSASALETLEFWRQTIDPTTDAIRGQVCILTVVIDSSTDAELLPICQPMMSWV